MLFGYPMYDDNMSLALMTAVGIPMASMMGMMIGLPISASAGALTGMWASRTVNKHT
jgi:hypothetical protein